jgi:hypothetical protein
MFSRWLAAFVGLLLSAHLDGLDARAQTAVYDAGNPKFLTLKMGDAQRAVTYDPDPAPQRFLLHLVHRLPDSDTEAVAQWIGANAPDLEPAFIFELARRLARHDMDAAMEWLAVGEFRARYDATRCAVAPDLVALRSLHQVAPDVVAAVVRDRAAFKAAGLRVIAKPERLQSRVLPWWICLTTAAASNDKERSRAPSAETRFKAQREWADLHANALRHFGLYVEEQGRSQEDPIPLQYPTYQKQVVGTGKFWGWEWLDNDRLVVLRRVDGSKTSPPEHDMSIWHKQDGMTPVARGHGRWCVGHGVIARQTQLERVDQEHARLTFDVGLPGAWKEMTGRSFHPPRYRLSRHSLVDCRWVEDARLAEPGKREIRLPLGPGDGYLEFSEAATWLSDEPVLHIARDGAAPVPLPIPQGAVEPHSIRYFPFKGAYFLSGVAPAVADEWRPTCTFVWWFWPKEGRTERVCVPADVVSDNATRFAPFRLGILRSVEYRSTAHGPKPGGLYLSLRGRPVQKIHEGYGIEFMRVAPDGCALAVAEPMSRPEVDPFLVRLTVIRICG